MATTSLMPDVNERVDILETFPFQDDQSLIEEIPSTIGYIPYNSSHFVDRGAFESKWAEETVAMEKMDDLLRQGETFINMVYTYRSCSKALPQVKTSEQANKQQIYEGTFEVLEPEIKKLKDLMYFQRDTIKIFCDYIKKLASTYDKKKETITVSESLVTYLVKLLDLFALLDALKNVKACLNNDFSFFKRASGFLRKQMTGAEDQTQENHTLYLFLAHQNSITTSLKQELHNIDKFEEVLPVLVNQCADFMEKEKYILPSEKHCYLRVMPYVLYLIDENDSKHNIFKNKNLNLSRYAKIFRKNPVVPLYGDMQITLEALVKRSPHFDEKAWGTSTLDSKVAQEYEIINYLDSTKSLYHEYVARFANMINDVKAAKTRAPKDPLPMPETDVKAIVLLGLRILSDWSSRVLQQSAWKYSKPNNDAAIPAQFDYERVVKYNYSADERVALIQFIAMIKGLGSLMVKHESVLEPIIKRSIHGELQQFIQNQLRDTIKSFAKKEKKKDHIKIELAQLKTIAADWLGGSEPVENANSKKKDEEKLQIPIRAVPPSTTQLDLILTIISSLMNKKKEFSSTQFAELETFHNHAYFYRYLLNLSATVNQITDLADLWYREFYLELNNRVQFPIETSLPWILTDHILESDDPSLMEYIFYPLGLYNDTAHRALQSLNQRFLYDEIEAELNLCFDQLLYKLSGKIFAHFKTQACSLLLDKNYKAQLELVHFAGKFNVPKSRFDVVLRQKHITLLGRSIDLTALLAQRQNNFVRQNIDYAISRYEASDLTSVIELETQLNSIRLTYKLLSEFFTLDPFESMMNEVNESTSLISYHGRIAFHTIFELMTDLAPNYTFNSITQRFIKAPYLFTEDIQRENMPKTNPVYLFGNKHLNAAYANSAELYKHFVGAPHIHSLLRVVGKKNLPLIIFECLRNMEVKIVSVLTPYVRELISSGMPASQKLPIYDYGTEGCYGYFQLKLRDIYTYPDLRPQVIQCFRELGNSIIFMNLLDQQMVQSECSSFIQAAPFLGVTPDTWYSDNTGTDPTTQSPLYAQLAKLAQILESKPEVTKAPEYFKEIVNNAWRADKFYRPTGANPSIFKNVLQRITQILNSVRAEWSGLTPDNGVINIDTSTEFYRLWSALQFVTCWPLTNENDKSYHELFGDGFMWAGCTIIHFLGQQNRFELFDFCYHILNVEDAAAVRSDKPALKNFFKTASFMKDMNSQIFSILNAYCPPPSPSNMILSPPATEQAEQFIITTTEVTNREVDDNSNSNSNVNVVNNGNNNNNSMPPPPPPPPMIDDMPLPPPFGMPPPPPPIDREREMEEEEEDINIYICPLNINIDNTINEYLNNRLIFECCLKATSTLSLRIWSNESIERLSLLLVCKKWYFTIISNVRQLTMVDGNFFALSNRLHQFGQLERLELVVPNHPKSIITFISQIFTNQKKNVSSLSSIDLSMSSITSKHLSILYKSFLDKFQIDHESDSDDDENESDESMIDSSGDDDDKDHRANKRFSRFEKQLKNSKSRIIPNISDQDQFHLDEFNLSSNKLDNQGISYLVTLLNGFIKIKNLILESCESLDGLEFIGPLLQDNLSIKNNKTEYNSIITLSNGLRKNSILSHLSLKGCDIEGWGALSLGDTMAINKTLTHLDISDNLFGSGGFTNLALKLNGNDSLIHLNASGNHIESIGFSQIFNTLSMNNTLTYLDLSRNQMNTTNEIGNSLVESIANNMGLETLLLSECSINNDHFIQLSLAISNNKCLKKLDLSRNMINNIKSLILILIKNSTLKSLNLARMMVSIPEQHLQVLFYYLTRVAMPRDVMAAAAGDWLDDGGSSMSVDMVVHRLEHVNLMPKAALSGSCVRRLNQIVALSKLCFLQLKF
ncbi:component of SCAR regulatory complex [Cavenderia fasciculata]|uniref:Component of SCAR regulatory complex n=1 Tax=Cavenderia fasciculata TaxID=261658 RepID=F4QDG7_CACFS|nr:component of SCAR regulatory complex [Cavenderia fasciculata]EGG14585.1 component of SCAR regulatory complex [Cavenderia fasciculata]|eukprot:XP_004366105.1 component of SCAR regulatory complex [Cavenderia fasciculata]